MISIGVFGFTGRMGQAIAAEIAADPRCGFAGGLVHIMTPDLKKNDGFITSDAAELAKKSDVVIDFTLPEATINFASMMAGSGKAYVCGTTGLSEDTTGALRKASAKIPVLYAPNTSLSLAAMKQLTGMAAKLLGNLNYDVAILDEHHRAKKDAPSGTAKTLGEAVRAGSGGTKKVDYVAIRAGSIVGEHEVIFAGQGETIRLRHSVTDRRIFARGAIDAALWLAGKPAGFYGIEDVLGLGT